VPNLTARFPIDGTSFIGRHGDLAALPSFVNPGRLLTLTGPGGVGKTRLALRLVQACADAFEDGVQEVDLAGIGSGQALWRVRGGNALVLLDGCEHMRAACAAFAREVLAREPRTCIVATSRAPLGVPGEQLWPVAPLRTPAPDAPIDAVASSNAVRLFVERTAAQQPGFTLTRENAAAVAKLCRDLDGLPLSLELAAEQVPLMGLDAVAAVLLHGTDARTSPADHRPERQRSLSANLEWSLSLVGELDRALLSRLTIFGNGWTLEAAEFVCTDPWIDAPAFLDALDHLVRASLVAVDVEHPYGRFQKLLCTVRAQLAAPADEVMLRQRLVAWYQRKASRVDHWTDDDAHLAQLDDVIDDLHTIFTRADTGEAGPERQAALGLYVAYWPLWLRRYQREGADWLRRLWRRASEPVDPKIRARASWLSGTFALFGGQTAEAVRELEAAVQLGDASHDTITSLMARYYLGEAYLEAGNARAAIRPLSDVLEATLSMRHPLAAGTQARLAHAYLENGELDAAIAHAEQALTSAELSGHHWSLMSAWQTAAAIAAYRGDLTATVDGLHEAIRYARLSSNQLAWVGPTIQLANAYLDHAESEQAAGVVAPLMEVLVGDPLPMPLTRQLLRTMSRVLAPSHPDYAARLARAAEWRHTHGTDAASALSSRLLTEARLTLASVITRPPATTESARRLTSRELQVARLLQRGLTNREIASQLDLSEGTVRAHVGRILDKLNLRSRVQVGGWLDAQAETNRANQPG
jgi:predicted ATPase/DNA-binding CsgD family transcriptional regulator